VPLPELGGDLLLAGDAHAHRLVSSNTVLLVGLRPATLTTRFATSM
jgi:hypothetical protein